MQTEKIARLKKSFLSLIFLFDWVYRGKNSGKMNVRPFPALHSISFSANFRILVVSILALLFRVTEPFIICDDKSGCSHSFFASYTAGALKIKILNPITAFKTPSVNGTKRLSSAYFVKPFRGAICSKKKSIQEF